MGAEQSSPTVEPEHGDIEPTSITKPAVLSISGPSGVGKGTLIELLLEDSDGFVFSTSHTTRSLRANEKNGAEYFFVSKEEFERDIEQDKFLEYEKVYDNYYGTSRETVERILSSGYCCILDIGVQGARNIRKSGLRAVLVFIAPPSEEELERRLRDRGSETEEQIFLRMKGARSEMQSMSEPGLFDFCIVNGDLSQAYAELRTIAMKVKSGILPEVGQNGGSPLEVAVAKQDLAMIPLMVRWEDKIALITQAGSKYGFELCRVFCEAGMRVIGVGNSREDMAKLQSTIVENRRVQPQNFLPVVCDTSKEGEVLSLRRIAQRRWPKASSVDILINLSSLSKAESSLIEGSAANWADVLSGNLLGMLLCSREVIKAMKERKEWGFIINVACPEEPEDPIFKASAAALKSITKDLQAEVLKEGLGVKVVSLVSTKMTNTEDIAKAVVGLITSDSTVSCVEV